jgi:hypothetical protein
MIYLHLSCCVTSSVLYYLVFLLLLVVMLFPTSTGYCLSCASFLKDVSQIRSWVVCGRSCFSGLEVFDSSEGSCALCCVGGSVPVAYRRGWVVQPPPPKFRSFGKAEPNSQFHGKYICNNLIRICVSLICKLSGTPD